MLPGEGDTAFVSGGSTDCNQARQTRHQQQADWAKHGNWRELALERDAGCASVCRNGSDARRLISAIADGKQRNDIAIGKRNRGRIDQIGTAVRRCDNQVIASGWKLEKT